MSHAPGGSIRLLPTLTPARLDRYLAALPAMSLIPVAPLKLVRFPTRSPTPSPIGYFKYVSSCA